MANVSCPPTKDTCILWAFPSREDGIGKSNSTILDTVWQMQEFSPSTIVPVLSKIWLWIGTCAVRDFGLVLRSICKSYLSCPPPYAVGCVMMSHSKTCFKIDFVINFHFNIKSLFIYKKSQSKLNWTTCWTTNVITELFWSKRYSLGHNLLQMALW